MKVTMLKKGMVPVLKVAVSFMGDGYTAIMLCSKCCNRDACKMIGEPEKKEQLLEAEDICVSLEGTWKNLKVCPEQQIGVAQRSGEEFGVQAADEVDRSV